MSNRNKYPPFLEAPCQSLESQLDFLLLGKTTNSIFKRWPNDSLLEDRNVYRSNCMPVTKTSSTKLWRLCREVVEKLKFKEPVDFYIATSDQYNASTIPSLYPRKDHHLIVLTSKVVQSLPEDALKFVIGHEVGHLLMHDYEIGKKYYFRFSENEKFVPESISLRMTMLLNLCELAADYYGLLASGSLMSSVLGLRGYLLIDNEPSKEFFNFIKNNNQQAQWIIKNDLPLTDPEGVHPVDSLRIMALSLHAESFNGAKREKELSNLVSLFCKSYSSPVDEVRFFLYGGVSILVCRKKGRIKPKTKNFILSKLADFNLLYDEKFATMLSPNFNLQSAVIDAFDFISKNFPDERLSLLRYVVKLIFTDKTYCPSGVALIFSWGEEHGFAREVIGEEIQAYCSWRAIHGV